MWRRPLSGPVGWRSSPIGLGALSAGYELSSFQSVSGRPSQIRVRLPYPIGLNCVDRASSNARSIRYPVAPSLSSSANTNASSRVLESVRRVSVPDRYDYPPCIAGTCQLTRAFLLRRNRERSLPCQTLATTEVSPRVIT